MNGAEPAADGEGAGAAKRRRKRFSIVRVAWLLGIAVVVLGLGLMWFEPKLIYFPMRYPAGEWSLALRHGPGDPLVEDVYLIASDGVRIHGWYGSARKREAEEGAAVEQPPVVLILHGNAGNVTQRYDWVCGLVRMGAEVLVIDYRGFGRSAGKPGEAGLYRDSQAAWDYLVGERGVAAQRIFILGESLGGGPAVELAARVKPGGLIVQSSFTSVPDVARHYIPWLPRFMVRTRMDSAGRIGRVSCRKLFVHSRNDEIIPYELGRRLYEAASEPREFYELSGAGHNDTCYVPGYYERLREFVFGAAP